MEASGTLVVGRPVNFAIYWVTPKEPNALSTIQRTGDLGSLTKGRDCASTFGINGLEQMWSLNPVGICANKPTTTYRLIGTIG
jgi:hypothetical protein